MLLINPKRYLNGVLSDAEVFQCVDGEAALRAIPSVLLEYETEVALQVCGQLQCSRRHLHIIAAIRIYFKVNYYEYSMSLQHLYG